MNPILSGVLSLLTGGISKFFTGEGSLAKLFGSAGDMWADMQSQNSLGNMMAKITGSRLTDADIQANQWSAEQAEIAFNRQLEASNTQYQRTVADMQAAGINPMFAASGSPVNVPASSAAASVSPSSAAFNPLDILRLASELRLMNSQAERTDSETRRNNAQTEHVTQQALAERILNQYRQVSEELRLQGLGLTNGLTSAKINQVYHGLDLMSAQIAQIRKQTESEDERINLMRTQQILNGAQARQIIEMMPYEKAYKSASTQAQKEAAALSAANAAYQNGLIDSGYIEQVVRSARSGANRSEIAEEVSAVRAMFRTGKVPDEYNSGVNRFILRNILQPLELLLDNFNPLAGILGSAEKL